MRLGSGVVSIEFHCGDVLWTNFDPVNFCPFDTFWKNTLVQINSRKKSCRTTYTNTAYWQKGLHYDTNFTVLLNADSAVFDDSSLPASKCLNPISFAQARKCGIIPNSTKVLLMWLASKMSHIPCSHWLTEEVRWGGALCDETN